MIGKVYILPCTFQAADDTVQMGIRIRLFPFYTTKKMTHVVAAVPKMRFVGQMKNSF